MNKALQEFMEHEKLVIHQYKININSKIASLLYQDIHISQMSISELDSENDEDNNEDYSQDDPE